MRITAIAQRINNVLRDVEFLMEESYTDLLVALRCLTVNSDQSARQTSESVYHDIQAALEFGMKHHLFELVVCDMQEGDAVLLGRLTPPPLLLDVDDIEASLSEAALRHTRGYHYLVEDTAT